MEKFVSLLSRIRNKKGQNTVEYLLMLTVVVGVVLVAGVALKKYMPGLFQQIGNLITNAAQSSASTNQ